MTSKNTNKFKTDIFQDGRVCTGCGEHKPWEAFSVHTRSKTGRTSKCKVCKYEKRKSLPRTKEYVSATKRKKLLKKTDPLEYKARNIRNRLLSRVKDHSDSRRKTTPTKAEIKSWLETQDFICYYSGEPLDIFDMHVDHKVPFNRGGTNQLENLCLCTSRMNTAKGGLNEEEFKQLLQLISSWEDGGERLLRRLRQGFY